MPTPFVHLHTHSHYSLLDGLSKIPDLVSRAARYKMPALALTDHGNLYGAIEFYKECKKQSINPIIGVEAYVAARSRTDKEPRIDNHRFHLTLLAQNAVGYKNLIALVTAANLEGLYYKPRVDKELLAAHRDGLIALSGCMAGELARTLTNRGPDEAEHVAREYRDIFGQDNYFVEVMHHPGIEGQQKLTQSLVALAHRVGIPLVATQDSHYLDRDDKRAHETLLAVQTQNDVGEADLFRSDEDFSFLNTEDAYRAFAAVPEAVENTYKIAERCDSNLTLGSWVFPDFPLASGATTHAEELKTLTYRGLESRGIARTRDIDERVRYELEVITGKGYAPYFLVVADLLRYAGEKNIFSTIRGSVAGSLVTHLIGITTINPLDYKLPFERFLNPERPKAPDIDMDFADNRRDEVIDYARKKYGETRVAQIGTFGTMLARGVVRDVARALGKPYALGDKIARLVPVGSQGFPMTIDRALEMEPDLKKMYADDEMAREVIDLGKKLEGCVRHVSVHAAGVVIAPTPLVDYVPLQRDPKGGKIITQYDMYAVEDVGLTKFDFLGIRNLSILADSITTVRTTRNVPIDIEKIPLDDTKTFSMLARGETMGLFQLGGSGMTHYLMELKPSTIDDINAMVALYRPGPMESIPDYIERKRNPALVSFLDERLATILDRSYGVVTYQDDVLLIAVRLAGYSWLEADTLRKAMGKKIPTEMEAQREKLIAGLIKNGMGRAKAEELWRLIEPFAAYGFNKAHAATYGRVAYQTAYMKANFPVEYMSAVLTAESGDVDKVAEIIAECKRMAIAVLPPDVNESFGGFTIMNPSPETGKIRFGLYTIKNFGEGIADSIIAERERGGKYPTLQDFLERVRDRTLNRKSLEALICCGAMDGLGERGVMLANIEHLLTHNRDHERASASQASLFSLMSDTSSVPQLRLADASPAEADERLRWEKELLGLYVSGHPLDRYRERLEKRGTDIRHMKAELREGMRAVAAGLVENTKQVFTKNGEKMLFVTIADLSDSIEVVFFPRTLSECRERLEPERCVAIKGRMSNRNGSVSMIAEAVRAL